MVILAGIATNDLRCEMWVAQKMQEVNSIVHKGQKTRFVLQRICKTKRCDELYCTEDARDASHLLHLLRQHRPFSSSVCISGSHPIKILCCPIVKTEYLCTLLVRNPKPLHTWFKMQVRHEAFWHFEPQNKINKNSFTNVGDTKYLLQIELQHIRFNISSSFFATITCLRGNLDFHFPIRAIGGISMWNSVILTTRYFLQLPPELPTHRGSGRTCIKSLKYFNKLEIAAAIKI